MILLSLYAFDFHIGQIDLIEQDLRSKKLNPNIKDKEGKYSLLQKAVYYNRRHLVTTLLDSGADLMFSSGDDADDNLQV